MPGTAATRRDDAASATAVRDPWPAAETSDTDGNRRGNGDGGQLERVTVNLTERAAQALETLTRLTDDTKTDAVNRALQVYAYLVERAIAQGGSVQIRRSARSRPERVDVI
jgi:hypothetical protein